MVERSVQDQLLVEGRVMMRNAVVGCSFERAILIDGTMKDIDEPKYLGNGNVLWPGAWTEAQRRTWRRAYRVPGAEWPTMLFQREPAATPGIPKVIFAWLAGGAAIWIGLVCWLAYLLATR